MRLHSLSTQLHKHCKTTPYQLFPSFARGNLALLAEREQSASRARAASRLSRARAESRALVERYQSARRAPAAMLWERQQQQRRRRRRSRQWARGAPAPQLQLDLGLNEQREVELELGLHMQREVELELGLHVQRARGHALGHEGASARGHARWHDGTREQGHARGHEGTGEGRLTSRSSSKLSSSYSIAPRLPRRPRPLHLLQLWTNSSGVLRLKQGDERGCEIGVSCRGEPLKSPREGRRPFLAIFFLSFYRRSPWIG